MKRGISIAVFGLVLIGFAVTPGLMAQVASAKGNGDSTIVVYLDGTPAERGIAYGVAAGEAIKTNLESFWLDVESKGLSKTDLLAKAYKHEGVLPAYVREEIRGMAEGAEAEYGDLLAMNLYGTEMRGHGGCTQFIAAGGGTEGGGVVASKNRDESGVNIFMVVAPVEDKDKHGLIAITEAGYWGVSFGLNDVGVCDGNNWMPIPDDAFYEGGFTELTSNRMVLEDCASVDRAIQYMDELPKYGGSTLMVADSTKAAFIETVPSDGEGYWLDPDVPDIVAEVVTDGVACHTNHYMYDPYYNMVLYEEFGTMWTPSIARYDNGVRLIEEANGVVSAELLIKFCRDLEDFGNSHPNYIKDAHPEIPWECWEDGWPGFSICNARTVSSGVFELDQDEPGMMSKMWTAIYNPCWCPYVPLHNGLINDVNSLGDIMMPYRDGTAWLISMRLRSVNENDWGCMVHDFEVWERDVRDALVSEEAEERALIAGGDIEEAVALMLGYDCPRALDGVELMLSLGSWVEGEYDESSPGEGLRSGEVGEKQA